MLTFVRSLWRLPAPADAAPPGVLDRAFVVAVAVAAVVETLLRDDLEWRWATLVGFLVWLPTLVVRRTSPSLPVTVFGAVNLVTWIAASNLGGAPGDLSTGLVALLIPYSLARWASGRDAVVGLWLFALVVAYAIFHEGMPAGDRIGATAVCVAAASVGVAVRTRSLLRSRQLDDVRQQERERLARDLHDTVAHHLTAIAISAQAGLAVADDRPEAAKDALRRIDEEASRTLTETREVVRMLRTEEDAPDRPIDDLTGLATATGPGPAVEVTVGDGVDALSPTVAAAVHRIAQEAVANARRHAVGATSVQVSVDIQGDDLALTVVDDGTASTRNGAGFGIVGMTERADLLGGRLDAGPRPAGGWQVVATLPVDGRR
ncbi:sensor histidine kinase [Nocardioides oleivorans]|uniref:histidine kinase n=1 Tax=Nocardioides oleivorans TaxID=273676 RepID=A0A4Q2S118_9ACTN|nr:sensor histidine kinase [Nocardioides oleivorans]RYB95321.1 sensor histidine kinase [Nocardioides oleivorans]